MCKGAADEINPCAGDGCVERAVHYSAAVELDYASLRFHGAGVLECDRPRAGHADSRVASAYGFAQQSEIADDRRPALAIEVLITLQVKGAEIFEPRAVVAVDMEIPAAAQLHHPLVGHRRV